MSPEPNPAESMSALAAEFVAACKTRGVSLDYLPRTLPLVDKFVAATRGEAQQLTAKKDPGGAAQIVDTHAPGIAAYVGEVIRRETGGSWYDFDGNPMVNAGDYQADPLPIVRGLLESGKGYEGDVAIESAKAYCDMISRMQRVWLEGTLLGTYESMTALRTAIAPDAKLAGTIVAASQQAVKTGKMTHGESLDFSSDSLEGVERIMNGLHKQSQDKTLTEEQLVELSKMWGIYVGEVIRRYYGGQWSIVDGVPDLALGGKQASPIAKARKRIAGGPMENLKYYFQSIMKVLSSQQSQ